jgi:hypothetical protein
MYWGCVNMHDKNHVKKTKITADKIENQKATKKKNDHGDNKSS